MSRGAQIGVWWKYFWDYYRQKVEGWGPHDDYDDAVDDDENADDDNANLLILKGLCLR